MGSIIKKIIFLPILCVALACGGLSSHSFVNSENINLEDNIAAYGEGRFYSGDLEGDFRDEPYYSTYQKGYGYDYMNLGTIPNRHRGDSVKVAVIDSGINYTHEDFKDPYMHNVIQNNSCSIEWDATNSKWVIYRYSSYPSHISDFNGHGTNVASVIASQINSLGCAGVAPNVDLYVYRVEGYEWGAIQTALTDCVSKGIDVINMSIQAYEESVGGKPASTGCSSILTYWLNSCHNAGITMVAAAGNYNTTVPSYPANNNYVIGVGSLAEGSDTEKASYSNLTGIDLVAPGTVYVASNDGNSAYKKNAGTSFSSPIVTAAIALYIEKHPTATPSEIESALYASCDAIVGNPSWAGHGRLNLLKFLGEDVPEAVTITNVTDNALSLDAGDSFDLDIEVTASPDVSDSSYTFELLNDDGTLSVDSNGHIEALAVGEEVIYVTSNANLYASDYVTVTVNEPPVKTLTLSPLSVSLEEKDTQQLTASTIPNTTITFASLDSSVATVTSGGLITAVAPGTTRISASANGLTKYCDVTVTKSPLTSIAIEGMTTKYALNSSFSFDGTCTATYHNGTEKTVTPTSVTSPDMTTEGNKQITVSYMEDGVTKTANYTISVSKRVSTGTLDFTGSVSSVTSTEDKSTWTSSNCTPDSSQLFMKTDSAKITSSVIYVNSLNNDVDVDIHCGTYGGGSSSLNVYGKYSSGVRVTNILNLAPTDKYNKSYTGKLSFTSNDDSAITFVIEADVDTNDSKYIRFFSLNFTYSPGVKPPEVTGLSLDKDALNFDLYGIKVGTITPTVTYEEGADTTVTYSIGDNTVASLSKTSATKDESITVTGLKVGTTTITATCGSEVAECSVTVVDTTPIPVTNISLDKTATSLVRYASTSLTATITPNNATNKELLWSTSNSNIVSISATSGSSITITATGTVGQSATVTASTTDGSGLSETCTVTIIEAIVQVGTEISGYNETVPYMNTYSVGDIVVKKVMSDGDKIVVTPTSTSYSVDTSVLGNHTISATFGGFTGTGTVKVTNNGASGNVGDKDEATASHTFTGSSDKNNTDGVITYSVASSNGWEDNRGHQWSKTTGSITLTGIASSKTIKSVTVVASGNCAYSLNCTVGGSTFGTTQSVANGDSKVDKTFTGSAAGGTIVISISGNSKSAYIKEYSVTYETSKPATPEEQAIAWAQYFNSFTATYCDESGVNTDVDGLSSIWEEVDNEYTYMTDESKEALLQSSNADARLAVRVYQIIVYRYGLDDFIEDVNGDSIVPGHLNINIFGTNSGNTAIVLTSILLLVSLSGGYIYLRKKKLK